MKTLKKWVGITESEWRVYHLHNDQKRLQEIIKHIQPVDNVFEIGSGCGFQAGILIDSLNLHSYIGIDSEDGKVNSFNRMMMVNFPRFLCTSFAFNLDIMDLDGFFPFSTLREDLVSSILFTEVLEHIKDYKLAFAEVAKVVRKSDKMVMTIPAHNKLLSVKGHVNNFRTSDIEKLCEENKLKIDLHRVVADTYSLFVISKQQEE